MTVSVLRTGRLKSAVLALSLGAATSITYATCGCWWPAAADCCTLAGHPTKVYCYLGGPEPLGSCATKVHQSDTLEYTIPIPPLQTGGRRSRWHSPAGAACRWFNVSCVLGCGSFCCIYEEEPTGVEACGANSFPDQNSDPCDGPPA